MEDEKKGPLDKEVNQKHPAGEKIEKDKKKRTVEVEADVLDRILKTVEAQGEKIKILTEVADKNRLTRVEELRGQGKLVKKVNLNYFDGQLIIGWKRVRDDVYIDPQGRLHEDQIVGLFFKQDAPLNGESFIVGKELNVREFARLITKVPVEVIEEGKDKEGNTNFTVTTEDGETIKIDAQFIN